MESVTEVNDSLCDLWRVAEMYGDLEDVVERIVALGPLERRSGVLFVSARQVHAIVSTVSDVDSDVRLVSRRGSSANEVSVQFGACQSVGRGNVGRSIHPRRARAYASTMHRQKRMHMHSDDQTRRRSQSRSAAVVKSSRGES